MTLQDVRDRVQYASSPKFDAQQRSFFSGNARDLGDMAGKMDESVGVQEVTKYRSTDHLIGD